MTGDEIRGVAADYIEQITDQFEELEQVLLRAKAARDYFSSISDIK